LRQLSPEDVQVRRDLGLCYAHRHQPGKAIDNLRAYLDAVPEAGDAEAIRKLLKSAIKMVAQWN
jgi:regulator of sirC expression with transglutaminase-like and TPR domain